MHAQRRSTLLLIALYVIGAAACTPDAESSTTAETQPAITPTETTRPTTTSTVSTSEPSRHPTTPSIASTTTALVTIPPTTILVTIPQLPSEAEIYHGASVWAVYVGVWPLRDFDETSEGFGDRIGAAAEEVLILVRALGYRGTWSACDRGAVEGLGLDPDAAGPSGYGYAGVYLWTEADAIAVADLLGDGVIAVVNVETLCLD